MPGQELRMRVFAGPNGSGKSTIIKSIREKRVNDKPIDFGIYINADDIAVSLDGKGVDLSDYYISTTRKEFHDIAIASGLIGESFPEKTFIDAYVFSANIIRLKMKSHRDKVAQIVADFLRKKLLKERKKFSFETVFSHPGKLEIMKDAAAAGYKVYLYFVSTESAEINVHRVSARKKKGGHDVPADRIRSRYERSLRLLREASHIAYQAFFFDNSYDGQDAAMFAHFKRSGIIRKWDIPGMNNVPFWFRKYYQQIRKK